MILETGHTEILDPPLLVVLIIKPMIFVHVKTNCYLSALGRESI